MKKALFAIQILFCFLSVISAQNMTDVNIQVFPTNHALNTPIDQLPVHPNSDMYVESIGIDENLHPDFGTQWNNGGTMQPIGIPYNVVGAGQAFIPITFVIWPDESDPGPWPIPQEPFIETVFDWRTESNGDRHMLIVDTGNYMLYETGRTLGNASGTAWEGSCGASFNLNSNELRTDTWTSADAAGLPLFPLLVRYDEVEKAVATGGEIPHAIRFTTDTTQKAYVWPARHYASPYTDIKYPPMGMRFRLKANFDISGFSPRVQAILRTFKKYGIIVADNGANWFISGTHDDRWNDDEVGELKSIPGSNFEAVDIQPWLNSPEFNPNSAAVPASGVVSNQDLTFNSFNITLSQNYPNPARTITNINYSISDDCEVSLIIRDILGNEKVVISNENHQKGNYSTKINVSDFSAGIYYYSLYASGEMKTGKMIIL